MQKYIPQRLRAKSKNFHFQISNRLKRSFENLGEHDILLGVDVVVHAAGPFKGQEKCAVLEAAISTKVEFRITTIFAKY